MNRLPQYISVSNEAIDHQFNGVLKAALVAKIEQIKPLRDVTEGGHLDEIAKIIKQHTGVTLNVVVFKGMGAMVELPALTASNPIVNQWRKGPWMSKKGEALVSAASKPLDGSIDLKKGKVDGIFSDVEQTLHLGDQLLHHPTVSFSSEEIAAIILHEVGHVFTYFEMMTRQASANYIIHGTMEQLGNAKDRKDKIRILKDTQDKTGVELGDIEELADLPDRKAVAINIYQHADRHTRTELGFSAYDTTGAEALADQFAARHGLSLPLVTGLDKITRITGNPAHMSTMTMVGIKLVFWGALLGASLTTPIGLPLLAAMSTIRVLSALFDVREYDDLPERYKRIRHQLIDGLKDSSMSSTLRATTVEDIKRIDAIVNNLSVQYSLLGFVFNQLIPSKRNAQRSKAFQQDVEALLANDLYVKASELEQI